MWFQTIVKTVVTYLKSVKQKPKIQHDNDIPPLFFPSSDLYTVKQAIVKTLSILRYYPSPAIFTSYTAISKPSSHEIWCPNPLSTYHQPSNAPKLPITPLKWIFLASQIIMTKANSWTLLLSLYISVSQASVILKSLRYQSNTPLLDCSHPIL